MADITGGKPSAAAALALAAAIVAAAAWLRFDGLGEYELWLDEAFTFELAVVPDLLRALLRENSPPLFYLLLKGWHAIFGDSETALRALSALFGTLFVVAAIDAGRRVFGSTAGLWAGAMAALAPLHVFYSQELRPYALLMLLLLLSCTSLWEAVRTGSPGAFAAVSLCSFLSLATHYFAALALVPAGALVWLAPGDDRRVRRRRYAIASAVSVAPCVAWLSWSFAFHPHPQGSHVWIQRIWENLPPALAIPKSLELLLLGSQRDLVPGFFKQFSLLVFPPGLRLSGLVLAGALGALALLPWADRETGIDWLGRRKLWLAGLLLAPLLTLWVISCFRPYYVAGRYDVVAFPALVLLLGFGLAKLGRVGRVGAAAAALAGLALLGVLAAKLSAYRDAAGTPVGPSARRTASALDAVVGDGDLVLFTPGRGLGVRYYLGRLGYRCAAWRCANADTGRSFRFASIPFDDEGIVLDLEHLDRVSFAADRLRADLAAALAELDASRNAVWLEQRRGPEAWLGVERVIAREASRLGFRRAPAPPGLRDLRISAFRSGR